MEKETEGEREGGAFKAACSRLGELWYWCFRDPGLDAGQRPISEETSHRSGGKLNKAKDPKL